MKKIYRIAALLSVVTFAASGCVEENLEPVKPNKPAKDGDEIVFGARAGFENSDPDTKTVYDGSTYTDGGKTYERINWIINKDKIEIYCPEAANAKSSHYTVTSVKDENGNDNDVLERLSEDGALQWKGDGDHHFYAMYPSSMMFEGKEDAERESLEIIDGKVLVQGVVDAVQTPTSITQDNEGNYIAVPDMTYAYMAATSVSKREQGSVSLSFRPIVTALDIVFYNDQNSNISLHNITIESSQPIAGRFNADLASSDDDGLPLCNYVDGETSNTIIVSTFYQPDSDSVPIPLPVLSKKSLKITVFLLPRDSKLGNDALIENLTVKVLASGMAEKTKKLEEAKIPFSVKTNISNLHLPPLRVSGDNWMQEMNDSLEFKNLSLPGAGGAFTQGYPDDKNPDYFKQQTLTADELWSMGIRAFEAVCDRPSTSGATLGGQQILCNKQSVGVTVKDALDFLLGKVIPTNGEPQETAMLILGYQSISSNPAYNPNEFLSSLKTLLQDSKYKDHIIAFTPNLTIGNARGKVIILCRPNQRDQVQDGLTVNLGTMSAALGVDLSSKVTIVDGCGSSKDRWGARGYEVRSEKTYWHKNAERRFSILGSRYQWGSQKHTDDVEYSYKRAVDISNYSTVSKIENQDLNPSTDPTGPDDIQKGYDSLGVSHIEYYMQQSVEPDDDGPNSRIKKGEMNFSFPTNQENVECWYQDWARVVMDDYYVDARWEDPDMPFIGDKGNYKIRWFNSYDEKWENITETFDNTLNGTYKDKIVVNSLCGYKATEETNVSPCYSLAPSMKGERKGLDSGMIWGGAGGDIKGLAMDLNTRFYSYLLQSGMEMKSGPTGVILMDYVSNNPNDGDGAAYYLPGAILANNYKTKK